MPKQSSPDPFEVYNAYYDLLYSDKNYKAEAEYIDELIKQYLPEASTIVELGCGTANYALHFSKQGYKVTGVERSNKMAKLAGKKNIQSFDLIVDDIRFFELDKQVDAAVSLFHVISYLTNADDLIRCFRQVHKTLHAKGLFIFDVWHAPAVISLQPTTRVKRIHNKELDIVRISEPCMQTDEPLVDIHFELFVKKQSRNKFASFKETHVMRYFTPEEISIFAQTCGFEVIKSEEFLTAKHPGTDTWGVCYILQKHDK